MKIWYFFKDSDIFYQSISNLALLNQLCHAELTEDELVVLGIKKTRLSNTFITCGSFGKLDC